MDKNNEKSLKEEENGSGRHRSPAFPMISFEDALTRVKIIYNKDKRANINIDTLLLHLNFKAGRAGTAGRVVAALKHYNLLDEKANQFKVSENGYQIIVLPESDQHRSSVIKDSALAPAIFQRLLAHYDNELPSDENLKSHLLISEKFNPESVNSFIKVFRANVNLVDSLSINDEVGTKDTSEQAQNRKSEDAETPKHKENSTPSNTLPTSQLEGESLKFRISRESDVIVNFSGKVTQEGIDKLVILLNATKDTYPTNEELQEELPQPKEQF